MNTPSLTAIEKAVIALLQPEIGYFGERDIVVRAVAPADAGSHRYLCRRDCRQRNRREAEERLDQLKHFAIQVDRQAPLTQQVEKNHHEHPHVAFNSDIHQAFPDRWVH